MAAKWSTSRILWLFGISTGLFNRRAIHYFALLKEHNFFTLDLVWFQSWNSWMRFALGVILISLFHGSTFLSMVSYLIFKRLQNSQLRQQGEEEWRFGKIDNLDFFFFLEDLELEILAGLTTISFRLQNFSKLEILAGLTTILFRLQNFPTIGLTTIWNESLGKNSEFLSLPFSILHSYKT